MAIDLQCDGCGKNYRVADQMAGKRIACKNCGQKMAVPEDDVELESYDSPERGASRRKKSKRGNPALAWIIGTAVALVGVMVVVGIAMTGRPNPTIPGTQVAMPVVMTNGPSTTASGGSGPQPPMVSPQPVTPVAPVSNPEYEKNVMRQTLERAQKSVVERFTPSKMAIVMIDGVGGNETDADHYLERKIFKAVYADYESGQKNAQQMTDSNRKQAEETAMAEQQNQFGGFGPRTVWYRYKPVLSDVPYPEVKGGSAGGGKFVYYVGPVIDVNQLGERIGIGQVASVDSGSRTVSITAALPVPIPDIDVEEMIIQHGREAVLTLDVTNAVGDLDRVSYFLETEVQKIGITSPLTVVGPHLVGPGRYRLTVGPVKDVNNFAAKITFGSIAKLDPSTLTVEIAAQLPEELPLRPSPAEIAEKERKQREGDNNPQEGESEIDWAIRVLKKNEYDPGLLEKITNRLALIPLEEARQDEVAEALIAGVGNSWVWHRRTQYIKAMDAWYNKKIAKQFCIMLANNNPVFDKKDMLSIMAQHPSEEVAKAAAGLIGDFFTHKEAVAALIEMGPIAEGAVLKYSTDQDNNKRSAAYEILAEIGTKKSVTKLKSNVTKERDAQMKQGLKDVVERLQTRLKESETTTEPQP